MSRTRIAIKAGIAARGTRMPKEFSQFSGPGKKYAPKPKAKPKAKAKARAKSSGSAASSGQGNRIRTANQIRQDMKRHRRNVLRGGT